MVDVREPDELQSGMIPSAVSLPLSELKEALEPKYHEGTFYKVSRGSVSPSFILKPFSAPSLTLQIKKFSFPKPTSAQNLIFYCRSGKRSAAAAEIATEKGYRSVRNYKGSWLDWSARSKARAEEEDDVDDTTGGYKN